MVKVTIKGMYKDGHGRRTFEIIKTRDRGLVKGTFIEIGKIGRKFYWAITYKDRGSRSWKYSFFTPKSNAVYKTKGGALRSAKASISKMNRDVKRISRMK